MTAWPTFEEVDEVAARVAGLSEAELVYVIGSLSANDSGWATLLRALDRVPAALDTPSLGA